MFRVLLAAAVLLRPGGSGPCDPETKPLTARWEHAFVLGSGAFFGRGSTPLPLSSSLRWVPSYGLDPAGNHRLGAIVGLAHQNPELEPQLGARYSLYRPLFSIAAGYEISPEVAVGLRTGHVRLGAEVDLALLKALRLGLRPQVDLPSGWPVLELVASFAIAGPERRMGLDTGVRPVENEDFTLWDVHFTSRVRIRASSLFGMPSLEEVEETARDSAQRTWERQCHDRERRLAAFLRSDPSAPDLDSLLRAMDPPVPEFAKSVRDARGDVAREIPAGAQPVTLVAAALRGLRRALQPEGR